MDLSPCGFENELSIDRYLEVENLVLILMMVVRVPVPVIFMLVFMLVMVVMMVLLLVRPFFGRIL